MVSNTTVEGPRSPQISSEFMVRGAGRVGTEMTDNDYNIGRRLVTVNFF
jgi:hypothetical protein